MRSLRDRVKALVAPVADLRDDVRLVVERHRRAGRTAPALATCFDMSAVALTLLRSSIALRAAVGSSLGTRAALRWVFKLDVWTDEVEGGLALPHPFNIVIGSGVRIERGCTIMHNVTLQHAQSTVVGENSVLGVGSVVLANRRIGRSAFCGANSVVTRDVPDGATVVGAPARVIRRGQEAENAA